MPKIAAKNRAKIRSLGPRKKCRRLGKKYVCSCQKGKGSYCYYRGEPPPPPKDTIHRGPYALLSSEPWGPTTMCTRHHHHGGRRRWWGGGRPSGGRPPATFPATFPVDPKMCGKSNGMYGGTYLGVLIPPVGEIPGQTRSRYKGGNCLG